MHKSEIIIQIKQYEVLLKEGREIETDEQYVKQYDNHLSYLMKLKAAFEDNNSVELKAILNTESHLYGWSFLPNSHGEKVESAFWSLKQMLLTEINVDS